MKKNLKQIKPIYLITTALIIFLALEDVFLILQNKQLKNILSNITNYKTILLQPGDSLKSMIVQKLSGISEKIEFSDTTKNYLLFLFNTTCPHCEKNLSMWERINSSEKNVSFNILGISLHNLAKTNDWINLHRVKFPIVTNIDTSFKISAVPQTVLVNGKGIVKSVWIGELDETKYIEIENSLKATLHRIN